MPGTRHRSSLVRIFAALLAVFVGIAVLFASGAIRHGLGTMGTYVVYVLAGLVTAVLCFGLLGATGSFEGSAHGGTLKLGGSVVAMLLITGGGIVYERYRAPESFDTRLVFLDKATRQPQRLSGQATILLEGEKRMAPLHDQSDALVESFPASARGRSALLALDVSPFRAASPQEPVTLDQQLTVLVERDPTVATEKPPLRIAGRILAPDHRPASGAQIALCRKAFAAPVLADSEGRVSADVPADCDIDEISADRPFATNVRWNASSYAVTLVARTGFEVVLERSKPSGTESRSRRCKILQDDWTQIDACKTGSRAPNEHELTQFKALFPSCGQFVVCKR
jgi:hypothetical protein